jgi:hypothetical protein
LKVVGKQDKLNLSVKIDGQWKNHLCLMGLAGVSAPLSASLISHCTAARNPSGGKRGSTIMTHGDDPESHLHMKFGLYTYINYGFADGVKRMIIFRSALRISIMDVSRCRGG